MIKKTATQIKPEDQSRKFLSRVPEKMAFHCHDGRIFRSMRELADGLATMLNEDFEYHVNIEKNDFSNWVRDVLKDEKLANGLMKTAVKTQAAWLVATRWVFLSGKLP